MIVVVPFRLTAWILLFLSCAITVISLLDEEENKRNAQAWSFEVFWTVILVGVAGALAVVMSIFHGVSVLRHKPVGLDHMWELVVILLTAAAWIMAIPVIMNPEKGLAIDRTAIIIDANLYFSAWWGFISVFALLVHHHRRQRGEEKSVVSREWICLAIASMVTTMAASHRIDANCQGTSSGNPNKDDSACRHLRTAITLAVFSAAMAILVVICQVFSTTCARFLKQWIMLIISMVVLGIWTVLVALLTFKDGPAKQVGTLFFGTWMCALLSLYVSLQHLYGLLHPPAHDDSAKDEEDNKHSERWDVSQHEEETDEAHFPDIEMGQGGKPEKKHDKKQEDSTKESKESAGEKGKKMVHENDDEALDQKAGDASAGKGKGVESKRKKQSEDDTKGDGARVPSERPERDGNEEKMQKKESSKNDEEQRSEEKEKDLTKAESTEEGDVPDSEKKASGGSRTEDQEPAPKINDEKPDNEESATPEDVDESKSKN